MQQVAQYQTVLAAQQSQRESTQDDAQELEADWQVCKRSSDFLEIRLAKL